MKYANDFQDTKLWTMYSSAKASLLKSSISDSGANKAISIAPPKHKATPTHPFQTRVSFRMIRDRMALKITESDKGLSGHIKIEAYSDD